MVAHLRTFHGHKVTKQELPGMVAHLQTFHAVVDAGCKDAPPLECSVRSDELPVSMRMRMRVIMCGYACTCAREFNSAFAKKAVRDAHMLLFLKKFLIHCWRWS